MMKKELQESISYIRTKTLSKPKIALVLGSGLGDFAKRIKSPITIPTAEIPNYPVSTVHGHAGKLHFGKIEFEGKESPELVVFQGRVHFYECNDVTKVIFPIQVAKELGCEILLVTNAAGGINRQFESGTLMFISDYINLTGVVPFLETLEETTTLNRNAPKFSRELLSSAKAIALKKKIKTSEGVYLWTKGPSYESAAEIQMMGKMGADAVGMSTVPEVIIANYLGMKVLGISCITNMGTGISPTKLTHEEVTETANRVKNDFEKLVAAILTEDK